MLPKQISLAGQTATQSATWGDGHPDPTYDRMEASRAIDGNIDPTERSTCSSTLPDLCSSCKPYTYNGVRVGPAGGHPPGYPWWQVTLPRPEGNRPIVITSVRIHNRSSRPDRLVKTLVKIDDYYCGMTPESITNSDPHDIACAGYPIVVEGSVLRLSKEHWDKTLHSCEVQVFGVEYPVLRAKEISLAHQTTTLSSTKYAYMPARLAIDGRISGAFSDFTCTSTSGNETPVFQVTLPAGYTITNVRIYNRVDCCGNLILNVKVKIDNYVCGEVLSEGPTIDVACFFAPTTTDSSVLLVRFFPKSCANPTHLSL